MSDEFGAELAGLMDRMRRGELKPTDKTPVMIHKDVRDDQKFVDEKTYEGMSLQEKFQMEEMGVARVTKEGEIKWVREMGKEGGQRAKAMQMEEKLDMLQKDTEELGIGEIPGINGIVKNMNDLWKHMKDAREVQNPELEKEWGRLEKICMEPGMDVDMLWRTRRAASKRGPVFDSLQNHNGYEWDKVMRSIIKEVRIPKGLGCAPRFEEMEMQQILKVWLQEKEDDSEERKQSICYANLFLEIIMARVYHMPATAMLRNGIEKQYGGNPQIVEDKMWGEFIPLVADVTNALIGAATVEVWIHPDQGFCNDRRFVFNKRETAIGFPNCTSHFWDGDYHVFKEIMIRTGEDDMQCMNTPRDEAKQIHKKSMLQRFVRMGKQMRVIPEGNAQTAFMYDAMKKGHKMMKDLTCDGRKAALEAILDFAHAKKVRLSEEESDA